MLTTTVTRRGRPGLQGDRVVRSVTHAVTITPYPYLHATMDISGVGAVGVGCKTCIEGRGEVVGGLVDVGVGLQEETHHRQVPPLRGQEQRGLPLVGLGVHVGAQTASGAGC